MSDQHDSFASLTNSYDVAITASRWWAKLYLRVFWGIDYSDIARQLIALLPEPLVGSLLEVPIGTAIFTAPFYRDNPQVRIVGVDYSSQMLAIAHQRLQALAVPNVALAQADVASLPFADGSFDCIISMNGMQCFPDKEQALKEMSRVLRPGGLFVSSFYIRGQRLVADLIAHGPLQRKGVFFGPHWTLQQATDRLEQRVGPINYLVRQKSIVLVACTRR